MSTSLDGIRALVTRPAGQADGLLHAIRTAGGEAIALPLIEIHPFGSSDQTLIAANRSLIEALGNYRFAVFVSTNAVRFALRQLREYGCSLPPTLRCFAIGEATAVRLREAGLAAASGVAAMNSEELLERPELLDMREKRVVIFKGIGGRDWLARELAARGALVSECALYHRRSPALSVADLDATLHEHRINVVLLSSTDALNNLLCLPGGDAAGTIAAHMTLLVPGQRAAELARRAGIANVDVAANATDSAMLEALHNIIRTRVETK